MTIIRRIVLGATGWYATVVNNRIQFIKLCDRENVLEQIANAGLNPKN